MKAGWDVKPLGDLLSVLKNGINCKQDKSGNGVKISRIESISDATFNSERVGYADLSEAEKQRYCLKKGDILFSHINSPIHVGKTAIFDCDEPIYHGVNLLLMRPTEKLLPEYLNFALKYLFQTGYWARTSKQSVNQASVNQKDISCVDISYPTSKEEQHRIVAILDEAFEVIATARANAEQNRQNARALFESYLQSVFSQRGYGWVEKTLGDIGKVSMCKRVLKEQTSTIGDIPFYKIGSFGKKADSFISTELYSQYKEKYSFPKKGDILLSAAGTIGRRVIFDGNDAYFQDSNIVWIANDQTQVLNCFLYHFYGACEWNATKGATILRLYNDDLRRIVIAFPTSLDVQKSIAAQMDLIFDATQRLESLYQRKIAALDELKQSLLQQAFSGQL